MRTFKLSAPAIAGIILVSTLIASIFTYGLVGAVTGEIVITETNFRRNYDYLIYKDGSTYYAQDGETGEVSWESTNCSSVFENVHDASSIGDKIFVHSGDYIFNNKLTWTQDYTTLEGSSNGYGTVFWAGQSYAGILFQIGDDSGITGYISLKNLVIRGQNYANDTTTALRFLTTRSCLIENVLIQNFGNANGVGLSLEGESTYSAHDRFYNLQIENVATGIFLGGTSGVNRDKFFGGRLSAGDFGVTAINVSVGGTNGFHGFEVGSWTLGIDFQTGADGNFIEDCNFESSSGPHINIDSGAVENEIGKGCTFDPVTSVISDSGTRTKTKTVSFSFGSGWGGSASGQYGWDVDAAGESTVCWFNLPQDCEYVIDIRVYAQSMVTESDGMVAEFYVRSAAANEQQNENQAVFQNETSDTTNFAANDIIVWVLNTNDEFHNMVGNDSGYVLVNGLVADGDDCATDARFRTIEIRYV